MGILTVGVVTKPFEWEGNRRMKNADEGLSELEANVDSLIVVLNEKLLEVLGTMSPRKRRFPTPTMCCAMRWAVSLKSSTNTAT